MESKCGSREPKLVFESKRKWKNSMTDKGWWQGRWRKDCTGPINWPDTDDEGGAVIKNDSHVSGSSKWVESGIFYSDGEEFRKKIQEFIFGDGMSQMSMMHPSRESKQ